MKPFLFKYLPHYHVLDYLSFTEVEQIYCLNQSYRALIVTTQEELNAKYASYYSSNSKTKLTDITPIISLDTVTFPKGPSMKLSEVLFNMVYGRIINKILQLNRMTIFKCLITSKASTNFNQLTSILQQLTYAKSVMITIDDENKGEDWLRIETGFISMINCIKRQLSILDVSVHVNGKNTFGFVRNLNRFTQALVSKQSKAYFYYLKVFYNTFKDSITNTRMSYQDFDSNRLSDSPPVYEVDSLELTLAFDPQHNEELRHCVNYLTKTIISPTIKVISFQAIDYTPVCAFIQQVKPKWLSLVPFKDVSLEDCSSIIEALSTYSLTSINMVNITNFTYEAIEVLVKSQLQLSNLRIGGMLSEETMRKLICFYLDNGEGQYPLRHLSLNGRIDMGREWCDLIIRVLSANRFELFHIDCFFEKEENKETQIGYMREIAAAFYLNETMKSFTIRNSVRLQKDEFIDVLKAVLKEKGLSREDMLKKFKHYAII